VDEHWQMNFVGIPTDRRKTDSRSVPDVFSAGILCSTSLASVTGPLSVLAREAPIKSSGNSALQRNASKSWVGNCEHVFNQRFPREGPFALPPARTGSIKSGSRTVLTGWCFHPYSWVAGVVQRPLLVAMRRARNGPGQIVELSVLTARGAGAKNTLNAREHRPMIRSGVCGGRIPHHASRRMIQPEEHLFPEHLADTALQPFADCFQRVQGDVLLASLHPVKRSVGYSEHFGELQERPVPALLAKVIPELSLQFVSHRHILRENALHMCNFCLRGLHMWDMGSCQSGGLAGGCFPPQLTTTPLWRRQRCM
jgi:hypothetical protein